MPRARIIFRLAVRSIWYSLLVSVWLGATTMLSPVWTPIGSKFSILQMVMQVSAASRITSYSISFQPASDCSTSTWWVGLQAKPLLTIASSSSQVWAIPPPVPPRVKEGRMITGSPICRVILIASSRLVTVALGGTGSPILTRSCLNSSRSSAVLMVSIGVPSVLTLYLSRTPASASSTARLSPV